MSWRTGRKWSNTMEQEEVENGLGGNKEYDPINSQEYMERRRDKIWG